MSKDRSARLAGRGMRASTSPWVILFQNRFTRSTRWAPTRSAWASGIIGELDTDKDGSISEAEFEGALK